MERLHILDGSGYIFRAFYGIGGDGGARLSTAAGMPTGALLVYTRMLIRLYREVRPERIVVIFDAPGRTFRNEMDDAYKATRREMPEELRAQLPFFTQITEAFCWRVLCIEGVEADDVIATLVHRARERAWDVSVYSADKDLMQLVDDHVVVTDSLRNVTYDTAQVTAKFGVAPAQMRDYLALVGDTSDNVPGMPGVGKVTAVKLLAEYGSIAGILAHVEQLKGKLKERFTDAENLAQLERSRELVTLKQDVELALELEQLVPMPWNGTRLAELFQQLEFNKLLAELGPTATAAGAAAAGPDGHSAADAEPASAADAEPASAADAEPASAADAEPASASVPEPGTAQLSMSLSPPSAAPAAIPSHLSGAAPPDAPAPIIALTAEAIAPVLAAARTGKRMAVHVEGDGARPDRARVIGMAVAAAGAPPVYIPLAHRYLSVPAQLSVDALPAELRAMLADPAIGVVCHDVKTAQRAMGTLGLELGGVVGDTMLAAYLLEPDRELSLERVVADATGIELSARAGLLGKGRTKIDFESVGVEQAAILAGTAAYALLPAHERLMCRLEQAGLTHLLLELELPLAMLLADIEQIGICLDVAYLRTLSDRVGAQIAAIERHVYELAGGEINIGSPKQLAALLFDKLGLKSDKMKKKKTGYSTDHEVLESLLGAHEIVAPILEHRELVKLKGTYLDALPPLVSPRTGRIHTSFNQAVAATGRLSSQDPNLQNIPIRTELGREIRRAFVAAPDKVLVSVDYSQIELRILAHLSADPVLTKAFRDDIDVHTQTAAEVFGIALSEVGAHERRVAKAVNYGLVYGQSEFGLARALGIERAEARHYINRYFERFSTVRTFMKEVVEQARKDGAATTILGRRRPIADIDATNFQRRAAAERVAQNTPMQGSAADIIKLAMLRVARRMAETGVDATMLLTVHDELVFEVVPEQADAFAAMAVDEMENAYALNVPLKASVGIGKNWADAH